MIERSEWRMRLGRWLGWTIAVVIVTVVASHIVWSYVESSGIRRRVAALKAAGEPILPADFMPPVDGPDNGGNDIIAAGNAVNAYGEANRAYDQLSPALTLRPDEGALIDQAVTALAAPLAKLDAARAKPRQDWKLDLSSPVLINMMLADMKGPRALCSLLGSAVLLDHEKGDDASALRRLDQMLFVARFADRHPSLVGHLVSIGCTALASDRIFEIAPDLKVGSGPGEASPKEVRKLIDLLLDEDAPRAGLRRAMRGERMAQLDMIESLLNGTASQPDTSGKSTPSSPFGRYFMGPVFRHNARILLDYTTTMIALADEPDLPAARAKLPAAPQRDSSLNALAKILLPSMDRALETHYRMTSDRRLAATVLAIRCYAVDHGGKRPAKLDELVPQYLPAVPKDSLLANHPIGYIADGERPRLYSAGANNVDDGGSDAFIRPYPDGRASQRGDEWRTLDRCVYLDRQPRPPPEADSFSP